MSNQDSVIEIILENDTKLYFNLNEGSRVVNAIEHAKEVRILDRLPENAHYSKPIKLKPTIV